MRAAKRESNVMIESQIFLTPAKGTRVAVPLKDPMSHGCGYVARRLVTDLTDEPFGHKILLNLTFNYNVSAEFLQMTYDNRSYSRRLREDDVSPSRYGLKGNRRHPISSSSSLPLERS